MKGFHHDYQGALERSASMQLFETVTTTQEFYKSAVWRNGIQLAPLKSFFPKAWTRQQVVQAITDAYNYAKANNIQPLLQPDGKYLLEGKWSENIVIRMYIENSGTIKTAFPVWNK